MDDQHFHDTDSTPDDPDMSSAKIITEVDINLETVHPIIREDLGMLKMCAEIVAKTVKK